MATLDKVSQLQSQGLQDPDIAKKLKDDGHSPQEINDALNQAKIKSAVSQSPESQMQQQPLQQTAQPIPQQDHQQFQPPKQQAPQQQEPQTHNQEQQSQEQEYFYPESQAYGEDAFYPQQSAIDPNTITEIAEQVLSEKFEEFKEKTGDVSSLKTEIQDKIENLDERLKRIDLRLSLASTF